MQREPGDISTSFPRAFTIHSLNNYANVYMSSISTTLNLDSDEVGTLIHMLFREAVKELAKGGVNYADLRWALTPRSSHAEIAFLSDSTRAYGFEVSKAWLPALWN
jgi:hypothetical protein